jgi:hypothetical protein
LCRVCTKSGSCHLAECSDRSLDDLVAQPVTGFQDAYRAEWDRIWLGPNFGPAKPFPGFLASVEGL